MSTRWILLLVLVAASCGAQTDIGGAPTWSVPELERVTVDGVTAAGLRLSPGVVDGFEVEARPGDVLRVFAYSTSAEPQTVTIAVDGQDTVPIGLTVEDWLVPITVDLRVEGGATSVDITARVEGGEEELLLLDPRSGPSAVGARGERPWGPEPANALVFLADTLRADALTDYGCELGLTPEIDAFADGAAVFTRAYSTASWTLPSQASLMTATQPYQHGATRIDSRLSGELTTLAEHLNALGWRTAAVTDSRLVSAAHGLDRGFELFIESLERDLDLNVDRALEAIDRDDGRPFFLYVQTYRVHAPYLVQGEFLAETRERLGVEVLDSDVLNPQLANALAEKLAQKAAAGGLTEDELRMIDAVGRNRWQEAIELRLQVERADPSLAVDGFPEDLEAIYRATHRDLSRGFGRLVDGIDARGLTDSTVLLFTSDHGEAFGEHDVMFHGNGSWDEVLAIPFVLRAPDLAPGPRDVPVSLVDVPRTLSERLGVACWDGAGGEDALVASPDRTLFAYDCARGRTPEAMVFGDGRKLVLPVDQDARVLGVATSAFELGVDPGELANRIEFADWLESEAWAARRARAEELMAPLAEATEFVIDPERRAMLENLGYY